MKVLHIIWSAGFGGIQKLVFELALHQSYSENFKTSVLFGKKKGEYLEKFKNSGLTLIFANLKSGYDISLWKYLSIYKTFLDYDILHIHSFNPLIAICAILSGRKIIYTIHGGFGFGRPKKRSDPIKLWLLRRFLNIYVDYVSFNSGFTKKMAEQRYNLHNVPRSIVYNCIDPAKNISPVNKGIDDAIMQKVSGKFVVGTTSRFVGFKRIDRLIEAFSHFQKNKDVILLLVGDGVLRNDIEAYSKKLNVFEKTIFTGYRDNVLNFQAIMDVCVFPSKNEPFGLVAVEAQSLGKPTIVFQDGGGLVEIIGGVARDDIVKNVAQLVERLEFYYGDRNNIEKARKYRRAYSKRFTIHRLVNDFKKIYEQLILN